MWVQSRTLRVELSRPVPPPIQIKFTQKNDDDDDDDDDGGGGGGKKIIITIINSHPCF